MTALTALPVAAWLGMEAADFDELLRSIFQLTAAVGFIMLAAYGWYTLTWRARAAFMFLPALFFFVKTQGEVGDYGVYDINSLFNQIGGAPLAVVIGWLYAFWCSFFMARIIALRWRKAEPLFFTVLVSVAIFASFSYCVESMGITAGWWTWTEDVSTISQRPIYAALAWGNWGIITFLASCGICTHKWWHAVPFFAAAVLIQQLQARLIDPESYHTFFAVTLALFFALAVLAFLKRPAMRTTNHDLLGRTKDHATEEV